MPKPAATRLQTFSLALRHLLPAWLAFALTAPAQHPLTFVLLLIGNALAMTGICHALGLDTESSLWRSIARRGLAYFVMLTTYTALVAALIAGPAWWLARDGSLPAALTLSIALFASLFALWRFWPAFALPLISDDAYGSDDRGSWLLGALSRSVAFARHLTGAHDLFFGGSPARLHFDENGVLLTANCVDACNRRDEIVILVGRVFLDWVVRADCGGHIKAPKACGRR